jgi:hypothetical protein
MATTMRKFVWASVLCFCLSVPAHAQVLIVNDAAVTSYNALIAGYKDWMQQLALEKYAVLRRMGRRLSVFVSFDRYVPRNVPAWRTWRGDTPLDDTLAFMTALNAGVGLNAEAVAPARPALDSELPLSPSLLAELSMLDLRESALVAGVDASGRVRADRRPEREAVLAFEQAMATGEGSATARADLLSAGTLLRARQQQAGMALALGVLDQLIADNVRARAVDVETQRMRQAAMRADTVVAGTADALMNWRAP